MGSELKGRRVALLVTDGFEESELTEPKKAIEAAGGEAVVLSPKKGKVRAWRHDDWGDKVAVDEHVSSAEPASFDGLVLPGGVMNPDHLRTDEDVRDFVQRFRLLERPIAAICHGPWTLIDAGVIEGRMMTSYPSLRKDLENAGARWVDEPVVVDGLLVTSRKPDDLPQFCAKLVEMVAASPERDAEVA
jgi:protease I